MSSERTPPAPDSPKAQLTAAEKAEFLTKIRAFEAELDGAAIETTPERSLNHVSSDESAVTVGYIYGGFDDYHDGEGGINADKVDRVKRLHVPRLRSLEKAMMGGDRGRWKPETLPLMLDAYRAQRNYCRQALIRIDPELGREFERIFGLDTDGDFVGTGGMEDGAFDEAALDDLLVRAERKVGELKTANDVHQNLYSLLNEMGYLSGWDNYDGTRRSLCAVNVTIGGEMQDLQGWRRDVYQYINRSDVDTETRKLHLGNFIKALKKAVDEAEPFGDAPPLPDVSTGRAAALALAGMPGTALDELYRAAADEDDRAVQLHIQALNGAIRTDETARQIFAILGSTDPLPGYAVTLTGGRTLLARNIVRPAPRPRPAPLPEGGRAGGIGRLTRARVAMVLGLGLAIVTAGGLLIIKNAQTTEPDKGQTANPPAAPNKADPAAAPGAPAAAVAASVAPGEGLGGGYSVKRAGNTLTIAKPAGKKYGTDFVVWLARPGTASAQYIGGIRETGTECAFDLPPTLADGDVSLILGKPRADGTYEQLTDGTVGRTKK